ncbi:hypothetical protein ACP4OV_025976 [Aristida adscensionis]
MDAAGSSSAGAAGAARRYQRYRRAVRAARRALSRISRAQRYEENVVWFIHLPLKQAAMALDVSCTTIRRFCRRKGVQRWPGRKIAALDRRIARLEYRMSKAGSRKQRAKMMEDWRKSLRERMDIYCDMMSLI